MTSSAHDKYWRSQGLIMDYHQENEDLKEDLKYSSPPTGDWIKSLPGISADDLVWQPPHYTVGGHEAIEVIKSKLSPEEYRGYCKGNILKYTMRANYKGAHDADCGKILYYAKELEEVVNSGKEVKVSFEV
jgi:hypothetical protein